MFFITVLSYTYISCKKIEQKEITLNDFNKEVSKNEILVSNLINGTLFNNNENNRNIGNTGNYTVSLEHEMLKFNNENGMLNFLNAMDTAQILWNSDLDPELEGLLSEKLLAGNPLKNCFDSLLNFNSLRKKYEESAYDNSGFGNIFDAIISDDDSRTILNVNNEVQIGTTIYKFLNSDVIAKISNYDYTSYNS